MITVLAGGVGAARFLTGLVQIVDPADISVVVNTADDFVLHGLSISPDLDIIRYTLAGEASEHGWGRKDDSWVAMNELHDLSYQAPERSRANDWFSIGDRDIATHLYRTQRLREGADLTQVTSELCEASGVSVSLLPMTNDRVSTMLTLEDGDVIDSQEYFVKYRHEVPVVNVDFEGAIYAKASRSALDAIASADRIIIAPSNPIVSITPILALPKLASVARANKHRAIVISPLIKEKAIKGPADHLMSELGLDASAEGIATYLNEFANHLVADNADMAHRHSVINAGMTVSFTETLLGTPDSARALAEATMAIPLD